MSKLLNKYLQVEPVSHETFMASQRETYDEVGTVIAVDESITDIPVGSKVYFDSFMAKKYPAPGEPEKIHWFVHYDEIVKYDD